MFTYAVLLFNRGTVAANGRVLLSDLPGWPAGKTAATVTEVWNGKAGASVQGALEARALPPHGSLFVIVKPS